MQNGPGVGFGGSVYSTSGPFGASGMPAIGVPVPDASPTQEWIASGPGRYTPTIPQVLPGEIDDVTGRFGFQAYERMLTDPAVWSNYLALKLAILNGPVKVLPAVRSATYRYRDPATRTAEGSDPAKDAKAVDGKSAKQSPKEKLAVEVAEFCERELKRLEQPFKWTLLQLLDALAFGNVLAEKTRKHAEGGTDAGKLVLAKIKVKPYWAWRFVVDAWMNVTGILTYVPPLKSAVDMTPDSPQQAVLGGFLILPREKFTLFSWLPKDSDPRGTSALRAAYTAWNLKQQLIPQAYRHGVRFGSPSLDAELAPGDITQSYPVDPHTGEERTDLAKISASQRFMQTLLAFQNNSALVRPNGSKLNVIEPRSNGEFFWNAFDWIDRQTCLAIGLQVRAALEAKHGSKADSETAENTRGLAIAYGRESIGDVCGREVLYDSVKLNYGEEVAEELCPMLCVGDTEAHDRGDMIKALASVGYKIGPSQLDELDVQAGMPERDLVADQQAAQAAAMGAGPDQEPRPFGAPGTQADDEDSGPGWDLDAYSDEDK